jgi:hypothetical protein
MTAEKYGHGDYGYSDQQSYGGRNAVDTRTGRPGGYDDQDVFGHEEGHDVRICWSSLCSASG